ncbi:MAG: hypothetical protein WCH85_02010 [Methanomicrobiales archaeon]
MEKAVEWRTAIDKAQALAELVRQLARTLDKILSSITDPIQFFDPDGHITYINLTGAKSIRYSPMATVGNISMNCGFRAR